MEALDLLWCSEYFHGWENETEEVDSFRLFAVSSGKAQVMIDGQERKMKTSDLLLLQPGNQCRMYSETGYGEELHIYDAKFDVHDAQLLRQLKKMTEVVSAENFQLVKSCFHWILRECEERRSFYAQTSSCYFWMILMEMLRPGAAPERTEEEVSWEEEAWGTEEVSRQHRADMCRVERYCREHYMQQISLDELTALINYNKTSLLLNFKEIYNTTPRNYIIQLRLQRAKELLTETDYSISEISEQVGFTSVHYFSRFFKEKEQYSPVEYRSKFRKKWLYAF